MPQNSTSLSRIRLRFNNKLRLPPFNDCLILFIVSLERGELPLNYERCAVSANGMCNRTKTTPNKTKNDSPWEDCRRQWRKKERRICRMTMSVAAVEAADGLELRQQHRHCYCCCCHRHHCSIRDPRTTKIRLWRCGDCCCYCCYCYCCCCCCCCCCCSTSSAAGRSCR